MRFREVYRYELEHTLRSAAVWVYGALLFLFTAWITFASHDNGAHAAGIFFNSPIRLTQMAVAGSLFGLLVTAGLFGAAAVRDVEAGMEPLLFTTPLSKTQYLAGRFLAALTVNAVLLLVIPLAQFVASVFAQRFAPELMGAFRVTVYLQAFPLLLIPALLFTSALLFSIAMLARQVIPVYLGAILFFISSLVAANYVGAIANPFLSALIDPSGIATLQRMSRYWAPVEQNTRLIGFPVEIVWSRVAWLALAAVVLAFVQHRFRFAHDDGGHRRRGARDAADIGAERTSPVSTPRVQGTFARFAWLRQTLAVARRCFAEVTASRAFVFVLLLAFGLTLLWGSNVGSTVFETPVRPVTHLVASVALGQRNMPIIFLLIALYAGEMVWKDRAVGMAEIADAAPVSEGVAVLGRFLAVVATLALLTVVFIVAGMTIQAMQGYFVFEPLLYLRILFGLNFANYVLWAAIAMTIHVVVNQKYISHMLMIVFFIVIMGASAAFGIDNHLLLYSTGPEWIYSEMNGFGPFIAPYFWFKGYWAAWAMLLLVLSSVLWVRGREPGVLRKLRVAGARLHGGTMRAGAVAVALILLLGGFIFYNTNILNDYRRPKYRGAPQAEYEKLYKRFENIPQPTIASAQLRMEIYPEENKLDIAGAYHLINRSSRAVDSVHVVINPEFVARQITFDRPVRAVLVDEKLGYRIYALEQPLPPGDSLQLLFDTTRRPRGFRNDDIPVQVVKNGSTFNRAWLPMVGYQPMMELQGQQERERFGLGPRARPSASDSAALQQRDAVRNEDLVRVNAILGTAADQIAVTPGVLRRSWQENGRSYYEYDTETPESFGVTVLSGRYAVREDRWKDVKLRVYYHPQHADNVDRIIHGMKAALEYYSDQFGPYQYKHLTLVEHPPYGGFGSAHPGLIKFTESFFLTRVGDGDVDEPFYGTAHEVAHMWWDGQTEAANVPGHGLLTESLANYSAMILTDTVYGHEMGRRVFDTQINRYLIGRAEQSREVPALDVEDQPYIAYRKGSTALIQLRDFIGEERVNAALRRFVEKYRAPGPPFPTSRDLYAELRAVTPDSLHGLLVDLFETITLWDVRTQKATFARNAAGQYEVTLEVIGQKTRADRDGDQTEVPMDNLVEVGVYAADGAEPIYLERHRIRSGTQTIRVVVPREPARAGVDPRGRMFDRDRSNNVVDVEVPGR